MQASEAFQTSLFAVNYFMFPQPTLRLPNLTRPNSSTPVPLFVNFVGGVNR